MVKEIIYNKVDTVTKTVTRFGDIVIKHRAAVRSNFQNSKEAVFFYTSSSSGPNKQSGAIKQTYDSVILESGIISGMNNNNNSSNKKAGAMIKYEDVYAVCRALDDASRWFSDDRFKDSLFVYSDTSKLPYKIAERYRDLNITISLSINPNAFLSIHPGIISDPMNNISYPGVYFRCEKGLIGGCTVTEFFSLKICVKNLLMNLYSISMELLNQYLMLLKDKYGG